MAWLVKELMDGWSRCILLANNPEKPSRIVARLMVVICGSTARKMEVSGHSSVKVFRSFGWMLPFILIPLLLATGFKAFLMALALPVGQSTLSFAYQRIWDRGKNKPKRKSKIKKRRSRLRTSRTVKLDEEWRGSQGTINKRTGYQSWVPRNDVSDKNSDKDAYSFGGWDDLDRREESNIGSSRRWAQRASRSPGMFTEKGKSSQRASQSDLPLLLRLLVAVFPFLGSILTKMM